MSKSLTHIPGLLTYPDNQARGPRPKKRPARTTNRHVAPPAVPSGHKRIHPTRVSITLHSFTPDDTRGCTRAVPVYTDHDTRADHDKRERR